MRVQLSTALLLTGAAVFALAREWPSSSTTRGERRALREWVESPDAPTQLQELVLHGASLRHPSAADG